MHRQITRALLAATMAGATIATLGVLGTGTAGASTGTTVITRVFTENEAGYFTGAGTRLFRFIGSSVTVAACQPTTVIATADSNPDAEISLFGSGGAFAFIAVTCGGGADTVFFGDDFHANGTLGLSPSVGDVLRVSIFRNRLESRDEFTVTNTRTGRSVHVTVSTPAGILYTHAEAESFAPNNADITAPAVNTLLWSFANTKVTTYSGIHGSLLGPWATFKLVDTSDGTATGTVVMFATSLANSGQNFTTMLHAAS